ncbi:hypothetical protein M378DRAFT_206248 [Amanita muscaria Koide BX008]|uniref:Uncharacterized protein n=1 Tax=Amanita muscaria (strain Koide BX008) TaxID=946122 RepID=A0A0C2TV67_AMAMK|nr:hypothetical protein M378DRAFT_206248 [Amanita muscaria Koide BX008]
MGVDLILCECLAAMVSWLDILLAILLDTKISKARLMAFQPTADVHQNFGMPSKYTAKFRSPTQLTLNRHSPRTLPCKSVVVLIIASELSSHPGKLLIGSFTRSCFALRPNSKATFSTH